MKTLRLVLTLALCAAALAAVRSATAQQTFAERFGAHNNAMTSLQPAWITPLVASDPRLLQFARASFSNQFTSTGTQTVNFGNGRGVGLIAGNRFEFDYMPPAYIEHHSASKDGFGDTSTLVKYRIASGNAQPGGFEVSALLAHCFATGSYKNGGATDSYGPTLAAGKAFRRFALLSTLGGTLPTGKIAAQGRTVAWNGVFEYHPTPHLWFETENNATFFRGGTHDGKMQNFLTPAVFYVIRSKEWKPTHPFLIIDTGMQIATSGFHTMNHNLIAETRFLF